MEKEELTKEQQIELLMKDISKGIDEVKFQFQKSKERKTPYASFNFSALQRARKALLKVESLGAKFRRMTIAFQKEKVE